MSLNKTYYIETFGCQANKSDSERIAGDYKARGWSQVKDWKKAGNIVVNTCAVRQRAENRADGFLQNVISYFDKKKVQRPKIILTGCMTHHGEKKLREILPIVDQVLPINEVGFNQTPLRNNKTHAWIPVSNGCNSFCTYCIVPYSRGREKSRPQKDIISEVKDLADKGYKEVTLLGQNVNSYGLEKTGIGFRKLLMRDRSLKASQIPTNQSQYIKPDSTPPFVQLLQEISKINQIEKIRFLTSNPWDFWDELIDEISNNKKIDRFIHLPVQSGSDKILKKMNRGYTRKDYLTLVDKIRTKIPHVVLGTDIIVGFPGETEQDFKKTVDLAKKADFALAFVAQYSPRPGTAADRLFQDDIPAATKKKRWQTLDQLINQGNIDERPRFY